MVKLADRNHRYKDVSYFSVILLISLLFRSVFTVKIGFFTDVFLVIIVSIIAKQLVHKPFASAVTIVVTVFTGLFLNDRWPQIFAQAYEKGYATVVNIFHYLKGVEQLEVSSALPLLILTVLIFAMISTWVIHISGKTKILLGVYVPVYMFYWYIYYDEAYILLALFLGIFAILHLVGLNIDNESYIGDLRRYKMIKNNAMTYGVIAVVLALILPKTGSFISSNSADDFIRSYLPFIENMREDFVNSRAFANGDGFEFSITSYVSEDGRIGGPVTPNDKLLMTVKSDQPFYLRGNVKSTFEGDKWFSDPPKYSRRHIRQSISRLENTVGTEKLTVTFENISSYTVFAPYRPFYFDSSMNNELYISEDYQIYFPLSTYKGESYDVYFDIKDESKSNYEEISSDQRAKYLQIPKNISAKFIDLTRSITDSKKNDIQKADAIAKYLQENYEYSLDVDYIPEGESVIDHFLFEEKKGYCTYFATATVLMLRAESIPARYIEGFYMKDINEEGLYEVRGDDGHAWVEAFIEGKGWVTIDSTPGYVMAYTPKIVKTESVEEEMIFEGNFVTTSEIVDSSEGTKDEIVGNIEKESSPSMIDKAKKQLEEKPLTAVFAVITLIILIIALRALYHFIKRKKVWIAINNMSNSEIYINKYHKFLKAMAIIGYEIRSGETHLEYAERINSLVDYYDIDLLQLTRAYNTAMYSNHEIDDGSSENIEKLYSYLMEDIKIRFGLKKYISSRYIKGKFDLKVAYSKG